MSTLALPSPTVAFAVQLTVSATALASVLLAGRRDPVTRLPRFPRAPWLLLVVAHGLLLAYSTATGQWGLLPLSAGMVLAGGLNLRASHRAARPTAAPTVASTATLTATVAPSGAP